MSNDAHMKRIFGLDLMRALAILFVILAHMRTFWVNQFPGLRNFSIFGYWGVELFFVLSGFLIGGILIRCHEKGDSIRDFWIRRWFRTLPNYYLFLSINMLLAATLLQRPAGNWTYWLFGQNLFYKMPSFFPESWSLTVEEWFYLLTPLLIYSLSRVLRSLKKAVIITILSIMVSSLALRIGLVLTADPMWDIGIRKITLLRLDSLMFGILGAWLSHYYKPLWNQLRTKGVNLGLVLTFLSILLYFLMDKNVSFFSRTLYFNLTSLAFFCFLPMLSSWQTNQNKIISAFITRISIWSYSLYLCHYIIMLLFLKYSPDAMQLSITGKICLSLSWLATSLLVSMLTYHYFEKPMTSLRDRPKLIQNNKHGNYPQSNIRARQ